MGTFSIWHWLIVLIVVMLIFGTGKIGSIGSDLGKAVKGFKDGMKDEEKQTTETVLSSYASEKESMNTGTGAKPSSR